MDTTYGDNPTNLYEFLFEFSLRKTTIAGRMVLHGLKLFLRMKIRKNWSLKTQTAGHQNVYAA